MQDKRRSAIRIMGSLITLVKPLIPALTGAVIFGVIGFLLSFGLGTFGSFVLVQFFADGVGLEGIPFGSLTFTGAVVALMICAITRGIFHYLEQYLNHFIAFTILAELRNKVFVAMRRLAPAKLEQKSKGNLVSMVKSDIELLEVFYAHTISPIAIAFICWILLGLFYLQIHPLLMLWALMCYAVIGIVVAYIASVKASQTGMQIRNDVGALNASFLDKLRGIRQLIQYGQEKSASDDIKANTQNLIEKQLKVKDQEAKLVAWTDTLCVIATVGMLMVSTALVNKGLITSQAAFVAVVLQTTTYGPFVSLASLGNLLTHTFASGERILSLLEEEPEVEEIENGEDVDFGTVSAHDVHFSYTGNSDADDSDSNVLKGASLILEPKDHLGISGPSGCGKSTLMKLLMRFWDPDSGRITLSGTDLPRINTHNLWDKVSYMTQTPVFFAGTLRDNLLIAKENATDDELWTVLERASIADMIRELPNGLDTQVNELGENYSGGERQRIALARCFLADSPLMLLDEPTSNLDSQNEAIILRSLYENQDGKTVILVSHRKSSLGICNRLIRMEEGKCVVET